MIILLMLLVLCLPSEALGATFSSGDTVTSSKLNNLNDANIKTDAGISPEKIDDHSASLSEGQETSDPYSGSTQTLAGDLKDELKQLRYQIREILRQASNAGGSEEWFEDPPNLLESPAAATYGDVLYIDAGGNTVSLSPGNEGEIFQSSSTSVKWATPQLTKLRVDLIKLAFRVLNADNAATYALGHTWIDEFRDHTGISAPNSTNYNFRPSANFDVVPVSGTAVVICGIQSTAVVTVPDSVLVEWGESLNSGTITCEVSRNGGSNYTPSLAPIAVTGTDYILRYEDLDVSAQPSGTTLWLKFTIFNDAELEAAAMSW